MMNEKLNVLFDSLFENIVGQADAKRKLKFYMGGYAASRKAPYFMLCGAKGQGKTTLAKELGNGYCLFNSSDEPVVDATTGKPVAKAFLEINASAIKSVSSLINGLIIPYVQDKDVTVFIDEAHELKDDVTNALLTILAPGADNTQYTLEEYTCDFDHKRQSFIFATSESQKVFSPLMDRMTRIDLTDYTSEEMAGIIRKHSYGIKYDPIALDDIVTVLRANARSAAKTAFDIKIYLQTSMNLTLDNWKDLKNILGIKPLGLNATEINVLRYLKENSSGTSLTRLSAKTGFSKEALQKDFELWLMKHNLMTIETSGRHITSLGIIYLKELDKSTVIP